MTNTADAESSGRVGIDDDPTLVRARDLAAEIHKAQTEKSSGRPYIEHPVRVAAAVLDAGGSVDQGVAALLHDTIEDGGQLWWPDVESFGATVTEIVKACSDAEPSDGVKEPWIERKTEHVAKLRAGVIAEAYLVIAADKFDAVTRTLASVTEQGDAFWAKGIFKGGRLGTLWYYRSMAAIVSGQLPGNALAERLQAATDQLVVAARVAEVDLGDLLARAQAEPFPEGIKGGEGGPG